MDDSLESVFRYLNLCGYALEPAWYQGTGYRIGWELKTRLFTMTWRQENDVMWICSIQRTESQQGLESAMGALISLWRDILKNINEIKAVRGLPGDFGTKIERQHRMKMQEVLLSQGARKVFVDRETWLVYP